MSKDSAVNDDAQTGRANEILALLSDGVPVPFEQLDHDVCPTLHEHGHTNHPDDAYVLLDGSARRLIVRVFVGAASAAPANAKETIVRPLNTNMVRKD